MTDPTMPDQQIINAFRAGDERAFKYLYHHYYAYYYSLACQYVLPEEAEEIISDKFNVLWKKRADFDNLPSIRSFLNVSIRNACIDCLRLVVRRMDRKTIGIDQVPDLEAPEEHELAAIKASVLTAVKAAIDKLPKRQREVMLLSLEGLSNDEIATKLELQVNSVANKKSQGIVALKKILPADIFRNLVIVACFYAFS
jgi:RNA polymerase sigma-70 factor (ECF subfamily)